MIGKICLGTVQLGLDYGINNKIGKPDLSSALRLLDQAWDCGIRYFDTANAYGDSEQILGTFIKSRRVSYEIKVITKISKINDCPEKKISNEIEQTVLASMKKMNLQRLDGILLHNAQDLQMSGVLDALHLLTSKELTINTGVSTYHLDEALYSLEKNQSMIQIPYNVFDRRFDQLINGHDKVCCDDVYARSPLLQGLLMCDALSLPESMKFAEPYVKAWKDELARFELDPLRAALSYSLNNPGISKVVVGAESSIQLEEICEAARSTYSMKILDKVVSKLPLSTERLVLPYLWNPK